MIPAAVAANPRRTMILIVALGDRHAPLTIELLDRARRVERSRSVADQISIEACPRAHAACKLAAVAQVDSNGVVGMTRSNNHRSIDLAATNADLDNVVFFK